MTQSIPPVGEDREWFLGQRPKVQRKIRQQAASSHFEASESGMYGRAEAWAWAIKKAKDRYRARYNFDLPPKPRGCNSCGHPISVHVAVRPDEVSVLEIVHPFSAPFRCITEGCSCSGMLTVV